MERKLAKVNVLYVTLLFLVVNSYMLLRATTPWLIFLFFPVYLFILLFAGIKIPKTHNLKLVTCFHGAAVLSIFFYTAIFSLLYHIILAFFTIPDLHWHFIISFISCYALMTVFFFNGVFCIYATSVQLGIHIRILGIVLGFIPIVNLFVLYYILKTVFKEVEFEVAKAQINENRRHLKLCATKYPILLVHGVFFRDQKHLNYWGRIPNELFINGARVYYGNHQSALAIADSAAELAARIKQICEDYGCEKVNIIAHSKGGLDCRYAIAHLDVGEYVASLTTISTPHRGCEYADYLLNKLPKRFQKIVEFTYNTTLRRLGDKNPDFISAVSNLTASFCSEFDKNTPTPDYIYTQSVGSLIPKNAIIKSPLSFTAFFIKKSDGTNDGLVGKGSFEWGQKYTLISSRRNYGISHCDMTDLYRKNIEGFDVREFYVNLVHDLKERGL